MNPTDLPRVLSAVLQEQEHGFTKFLNVLRVGHSTLAAVTPPAQENSPVHHLSDIESY